MQIDIVKFRVLHPFVVLLHEEFEPGKELEPLRFHSLRCAAKTANFYGVGVRDEWSGKEYSVFECRRIANQ